MTSDWRHRVLQERDRWHLTQEVPHGGSIFYRLTSSRPVWLEVLDDPNYQCKVRGEPYKTFGGGDCLVSCPICHINLPNRFEGSVIHYTITSLNEETTSVEFQSGHMVNDLAR